MPSAADISTHRLTGQLEGQRIGGLPRRHPPPTPQPIGAGARPEGTSPESGRDEPRAGRACPAAPPRGLGAALAPLLLALAAACTPGPETRVDPHTGITTHASGLHVLNRQPDATLSARALSQSRGAETRYSVHTTVQRTDGNAPVILGAWSFTRSLPYTALDRRYAGCGPRCAREETGFVTLDRAGFLRAAKTGLSFKLSGRRGSYAGHLPADAFAEVLRRTGDCADTCE